MKTTVANVNIFLDSCKCNGYNAIITVANVTVNNKKESEMIWMKLDRNKVNVAMARKKMTVVQLADAYGVSRARMNVILNSQVITPICAGRVADALGVDVTEILED